MLAWTKEGSEARGAESRRLSFTDKNDKAAEPPIIAVSSGKGGVGKTVLAANLARLVSWSGNRVLLVDLDLYSRGSSALIADAVGKDKTTIADLLEFADDRHSTALQQVAKEIRLVEAPGPSNSLYLLASTHSSEVVLGPEYKYDVPQLKTLLSELVAGLVKAYDLKCVIFDCRPGPEPLFLAAAGISTDILLITEPDMVTWDSNISLFNCIYSYYRHDAKVLLGVQFVINRIPDRYDTDNLVQVYQRRISRFLRGRRILAAIPFDHDVHKSFTLSTFFVDDLPSSFFVQRVAAIADELFSLTHPELLSEQARNLLPAPQRSILKSILGKRPMWANMFILLGVVYAVAGILVAMQGSAGSGQLAGLLAVLTGAIAFLFVALYATRSSK